MGCTLCPTVTMPSHLAGVWVKEEYGVILGFWVLNKGKENCV
jgi:hypothetical protein